MGKEEIADQFVEMDKRVQGRDYPLGKKRRLRQQLLFSQSPPGVSSGSNVPKRKQEQFCLCPVCNRSFPSFRLEEHVNLCLDSASAPSSTSASAPSCNASGALNPVSSTFISGNWVHSTPERSPLSNSNGVVPPPLPSLNMVEPCKSSLTSASGPAQASEVTKSLWMVTEDIQPCHFEKKGTEVENRDFDGDKKEFGLGFALSSVEETLSDDAYRSRLPNGIGLAESAPSLAEANARGQWADISDVAGISGSSGKPPAVDDVGDSMGQVLDRPPPGFKLYHRQVQSQARLTMFHNFSSSPTLEQRRRTVTVLQPGMVLFRNWLDLETQQKLVMESQGVAHLFQRASTAGGGKYHVYSMCWGPKFDSKTHRYLSHLAEHLLPQWMFDLAQSLATQADTYSPVYLPGSTFAPDVGLVNFYPAKADELGVIGLGGHQDLDDSGDMPVVSVSVGDSMTFFYRRLPPFSRRKSGILISVDEKAAKACEDGDNAHNREHQIVLASGDVLVFGGESRLVYHGTRNVQPGTRPPGLHVAPGRLNFTFRQTASKPLF